MAYQVLYRTYRPARFDEVVGQDYIVKTLTNAIKLNKIAHAYLFAGPRGTGKTTIAKLFAKAINCANYNNESCDVCDSCKAYLDNNHPDIIEMDAASNNSVDNVRKIIEEIPYAPLIGRYKIYIIDEAHMLSASAFNALLKTLEEPPEHVIFILATTDPQKIIPTVLSRCQKYNFSKISIFDIKRKMKEILEKEKIKYEEKALDEISSLADGGMRDALSTLEQILSYNTEGVFLNDVEKIFGLSTTEEKINILTSIHSGKVNDAISIVNEMYQKGIDIKKLIIDLLEILKEILLFSENGSDKLLNKISSSTAANLLNLTSKQTALNDISFLEESLYRSYNQNLLPLLELSILKMSEANKIKHFEEKEEKKEEPLEQKKKKEENIPVEEYKPKASLINGESSGNIDLDYVARLLVWASKQDKINDAVIFNRLELYKFDTEKRKFYDLLSDAELFASSSDAIIIIAPLLQTNSINSTEVNRELYEFINNEFGIDKMIYAVNVNDKNILIEKYKNLSEFEKNERPEVIKYNKNKVNSPEDKLKEMFENVEIK